MPNVLTTREAWAAAASRRQYTGRRRSSSCVASLAVAITKAARNTAHRPSSFSIGANACSRRRVPTETKTSIGTDAPCAYFEAANQREVFDALGYRCQCIREIAYVWIEKLMRNEARGGAIRRSPDCRSRVSQARPLAPSSVATYSASVAEILGFGINRSQYEASFGKRSQGEIPRLSRMSFSFTTKVSGVASIAAISALKLSSSSGALLIRARQASSSAAVSVYAAATRSKAATRGSEFRARRSAWGRTATVCARL